MSQAIDLSQTGLDSAELAVLQQAQHELAQGDSSSSRAASRASSQGVLLIDSSSLAQLSHHLDRVMRRISDQMAHLTEQSEIATNNMYDQTGQLVEDCDAEIERYHSIIRELDELDVDFDRIRHIKDIVKSFRARAEAMERDLENSQPSSSRHRDHKHHHKHHSSKKDKKSH